MLSSGVKNARRVCWRQGSAPTVHRRHGDAACPSLWCWHSRCMHYAPNAAVYGTKTWTSMVATHPGECCMGLYEVRVLLCREDLSVFGP